jgi:pimeloyl-[acyl-carrier protein] methyl ester esterase
MNSEIFYLAGAERSERGVSPFCEARLECAGMGAPPEPLLTLLLPGLEGTGRLFSRFLAAGGGGLELRAISYPRDRFLGYADLEELVARELPADRPFALLGESFSGPLALRLAAKAPPGLVGVILVTTFHRKPAAPLFRRLSLLAPAFFRMPLPPHVVRLLLAGSDAPDDVVAEVRSTVATVDAQVMAARVREALQVDATDALLACPVPILFLGGKDDRLLRSALPIEIRSLRPDAEIRMLDAPHLVLQRRPKEAMELVTSFLQRCHKRLPGKAA